MKQLLIFSIVAIALSCQPKTQQEPEIEQTVVEYNNPPAEGFDLDGSHPVAILLADQVMNAMGGRAQWDKTNCIFWNFFDARTLLWDKANNRVRVDYLKEDLSVALDMNTMKGKVWKNGVELPEDSLPGYFQNAKSAWINDSYWLVMPFKLKDSGVTLSYLREDTTQTGEKADVLGLTFKGVGDTPQNAYELWVSIESRLITQWAYFSDAQNETPNFIQPWQNYVSHDGLLLSGDRGGRQLTQIKVLPTAPEEAFRDKDWQKPS